MKTFYFLMLVILLSACSFSANKVPDKLYYRFPVPIINIKSDQNKFLIIKKPTALGILGNRPMVVQNADGGLTQMQHSFWLESPRILLQNYLNSIFITPVKSSLNNNILLVQILHLEKKNNTALLELNFTIKSPSGDVLFDHNYKKQEQLTTNSIPAFVESIAHMLQETTQQFITDRL